MFDKFKDLAKLKKLQDEAKAQQFTAERDGAKVVVNGAFMVEEIILNEDHTSSQSSQLVKELINDVNKSAQQAMAAKFQGMM